MKLILTEKPSVSRQVKDALDKGAKYKELYKSGKKNLPPIGCYESDRFVICSSVGHIVSIKKPRDISDQYTFDLDVLPYTFPKDLPLEIKSEQKKIFDGIQKCFKMHSYDEIIIATDGDREGQNIWRKIALKLEPFTGKISRMWLSEWTPEGIRKAYNERFDNSKLNTLSSAAQCREEADYIVGMNCTAALTAQYCDPTGGVLSIGRVMGPTMKIVVDREREIISFRPESYTAISLESDTETQDTLTLKCSDHFKNSQADDFLKQAAGINPHKICLHKEVKEIRKKCPKLYDATTIAQDMNRRYGFSAKKTADIIQKLYQTYALTTYPGTNSTQISEGSAAMAYQAFQNLSHRKKEIDQIKHNSWKPASHVVTKKGLAHEAITPVYGKALPNALMQLSDDERKVYDAITDRFLQIFYPDAILEETEVSTEVWNHRFAAKGKMVKEAGWMEIAGVSKENLLPLVLNNKEYELLNIATEKKLTTPPVRYTEETLLSAMKNAGGFVDDQDQSRILKETEGLGTGRTRPAIIEKIKNIGYFSVKKKSIYPSKKCMDLFEIMPNSSLSSPSMTAEFEMMIQAVEEGSMDYTDFMKRIELDVENIVNKIKNDHSGKKIGGGMISEFCCPKCNAPLTQTDKAVGCSNWKNGCDFTIWKTMAKKKLTENQIKQLIENGETDVIHGFKSNAGKSFDAALKLNSETKKVEFDFTKTDNGAYKTGYDTDWGLCPICGKPLVETGKAVGCSGWKEGCGFTIWKTMSQKRLSEKEIRELIQYKATLKPVKGMKKADGTPFKSDPKLVWSDQENRIIFEFGQRRF